MLQTKRNLLFVALASAMALSAQAALAQSVEQNDAQAQDKTAQDAAIAKGKAKQAQATDLDKVTITGIRGAINRSVDAKQDSTSIVETISAEDIGKLPDASIADSLARLPGLTAQRDRGRAADINIRGFAGDFAATTLNGREQASTGDNRGVEFDQYPSEVLSGVTVYKTPDAHLVGQGLSGTVDMQTVRPLSYDKRVVSLNARYDENKIDNLSEHGNRYSASYIDQFFDHTLGVAIGFAHEDSPQPNYQNEAYGYTAMPGATDGTEVIGGGKVYKIDDRNQRDGVMATVQFKPNDAWESTLDVFHSHFKRPEIKTGLEFGTVWGPGGQVLESATVEGATATQSSWSNVHPVIRMDSNPIDDTLDSIGWNNKFHFAGNWTLNTDLSYSRVKRKMRFLETYAGVASGDGTTVDIGLDPSGEFNNYTFGTDFGDPSNLVLTDAAGWGQDGYLKDFLVNDKVKQGRINLVRDIDEGAVSSIDFGINVTKRTKTKSSSESKLCLVTCSDGMNGDTAAFPGSSVTDFGGFGGIGGLASYNAEDALDSGIWNLDTKYDPSIAAKNWSVDEKLTTLYFQANIDTEVFGMPLRGNAGVQQVYTSQNSDGYGTYSGNPAGELVSAGASYAELLPSLNLGLEFVTDTYLRFAAGKQMARPRMDQMKAGMDVSICTSGCSTITLADGSKSDGPYWSGSGGNPKLKPWMANAFDLSFEHYFSTEAGNRGYLGAAYFYKDLSTYIYTQNTLYDFSGDPLPAQTSGQEVYPTGTEGLISQPVNGQGGKIHGYELTASVPLDLLWAPLDGFGLIATYSDTKSQIKPFGPDSTQPLPGLSKYVSNITAYWEYKGFSVRYNYRTRSAFLGETRAYGADLQFINFAADTVQDAQVNYTFPDSSRFKGLSLYLQVSNIGDEASKTYDAGDPTHRPIAYYKYGRTTLAGLGYRF